MSVGFHESHIEVPANFNVQETEIEIFAGVGSAIFVASVHLVCRKLNRDTRKSLSEMRAREIGIHLRPLSHLPVPVTAPSPRVLDSQMAAVIHKD